MTAVERLVYGMETMNLWKMLILVWSEKRWVAGGKSGDDENGDLVCTAQNSENM